MNHHTPQRRNFGRSALGAVRFFAPASALLFTPFLVSAQAQTGTSAVISNLPTAPATTSAAATAPAPNTGAIAIVINGAPVASDPAPLLDKGTVFVPLRGVLENLGAQVNYVAADNRIDIEQNGRKIVLRPGVAGAIVDLQAVDLVPPRVVNGRTFVPLRALAELFGYGVNWIGATRTVQITAERALPTNHRAALEAAGRYGVSIDFHLFPVEQVPELLDAAKAAGAGLVKVKFDWATLEPSKGAAYNWELFDIVVREARARKLVVTGIFGDTAPWAATFTGSDENTVRRSPPRPNEMPSWANYVRRVVGRYRADVHAWQVWVNPSASNFLTSRPANYRILARTAVEAAKAVHPGAIVHIAESGGADIQTVSEYNANGLTPLTDGIAIYPAASWQQGSVAAPEEVVRPYATIRQTLQIDDKKARDFWFGGLAFPVATQLDESKNGDAEKNSLRVYTAPAQADYLVKTTALGLALGAEKVFVAPLRDAPNTPVSNGISVGYGLQSADGTPRPAQSALQTISRVVGNKPFAGALSFNSQAIALLFDDKKSGVVVAWSPRGAGVLNVAALGTIPEAPNLVGVDVLPDAQILSATGREVPRTGSLVALTSSPIFVTQSSRTTLEKATNLAIPLAALQDVSRFSGVAEVSATFDPEQPENGLFWRKYANFPSEADKNTLITGNRYALSTQPQRNALDLRSQKPFIHFDVADDFVFNSAGEDFELVVEVRRPPLPTSSLLNNASGFRVEYDSITGNRNTAYQNVESGEGFATIVISLPQARFSNSNGYDFAINSAGSKAELAFTSVILRRAQNTALPENQ